MAKETFIMMSLDENKSKELAKAIGSGTARKILDYLSSKEEAAESQIATALKIPLSTAHYNVQQLKKAGLIEAENFAWSEKGKKVELYRAARKIIILAPKGSESFMEKVKGIIPVAATALIGTAAIYAATNIPRTATRAISASKDMAEEMLLSAPMPPIQTEPNQAFWFLLGSAFTLTAYLAYSIYRRRKK